MRRFTRLPALLCMVLSLPGGATWCLTLQAREWPCRGESKQNADGKTGVDRDQELFRSATGAVRGSRYVAGTGECLCISGGYPGGPLRDIMYQAIEDSFYIEGCSRNLAQAEADYRDWLQFVPDSDPVDSGKLDASLQGPEPVPNWYQLLRPAVPPLDPDVRALSDKDRGGLFGPVKVVRECYEFTSSAKPEWNPEWANRPESYYQRTITYDLTGAKVSEQCRPGCGMGAPEKKIFDSKGRRVKLISYREDGTVERHVLFSYDFNGWLIETDVYGADGNLQAKWTYSYVSDSYGNWIAQIPKCLFGCAAAEGPVLAVRCRSVTYYE